MPQGTLVCTDPAEGLAVGDREWLAGRTDELHRLFRVTARSVIEAGRIIAEVKARLGPGYYLAWVSHALPFSARTASAMQAVAAAFGGVESETLDHLDPTALYVLVREDVPEPVRESSLARAAAGEHVTAASVRAAIAQARKPAAAEAAPAVVRDDLGRPVPAPLVPTWNLNQEWGRTATRLVHDLIGAVLQNPSVAAEAPTLRAVDDRIKIVLYRCVCPRLDDRGEHAGPCRVCSGVNFVTHGGWDALSRADREAAEAHGRPA